MLVYLFFQCLPFLKIMLYNLYYVNQTIQNYSPAALWRENQKTSEIIFIVASNLLNLRNWNLMTRRTLLISVISLLFTAFLNAADVFAPDSHAESLQDLISEYVHDSHISPAEQKILTPRQSNVLSHTQTRTVSKRPTTQRNSNRYLFYTSGKPVGEYFIRSYQLTVDLFPTGLCETCRFFIRLCKLII